MTTDEKYMWRCIQIARNGVMETAPNPMVGAVIVCDGVIIGEGYHIRCGEAHAEVNAIRSVKDQSLLRRSTIYVSLEPCAHYGKTPPCADLIVEKGIPRIVVGCQDPFSKVAGRGIQKLRDAGRSVTVGVLEEECWHLIRRFITSHTHQRPFVMLKWAQSADGFIDKMRSGGSPVRLSTALTSMLVHKRRSEVSAIMVGTRTALLDNPSLTVRLWGGRNPLRVVVDRRGVIPSDSKLFDGEAHTVVYTVAADTVDTRSVEYVRLDASSPLLPQLLLDLYKRGVQSLMVEGGACLLRSFIASGLWDEAYIERSAVVIGSGVEAPVMPAGAPSEVRTLFGVDIEHYENLNA
jgi:diaminohydroxyphosphoribosylaminopyrimidine deaminase/5-amino-6-(5-phosphoribosylamino)uracil reductase